MPGKLRPLIVLVLTITFTITGMVTSVSNPSKETTASASSSRTLVSRKFQSKRWLREHNRLRRTGGRSFSSSVSPAMFECGLVYCWDVRNIRTDGRPWHRIKGHSVLGGPNGESIGMDFQSGVANGISNKFGLSLEFLSLETGVNITLSWSVTVKGSVDVPRGKCLQLNAYKVYQDYKAELWKKFPTDDHWTFHGNFRFWEFVGTGFRSYEVPCS